jgi:ribonuclease HII
MILPTTHQERQAFPRWCFGVDEVGRGCLAGPVVAAAVAFDWSKNIEAEAKSAGIVIADSKKLSAARRKEAVNFIKNSGARIAISSRAADVIDEINILQAALASMKDAVAEASQGLEDFIVLVDGNQPLKEVAYEQETITGGDAKVFSIAAASIIAKEYRDELMRKAHEEYPEYHFIKNVGYGTKVHRDALIKFGPTPLHRRSFLSKILSI